MTIAILASSDACCNGAAASKTLAGSTALAGAAVLSHHSETRPGPTRPSHAGESCTRKTKAPMRLTVILSTYNAPEALDLVLTGYEGQTYADFDIVIADDGSTSETRAVIERFRSRGRLTISHEWHEDTGFRKCTILNRAIAAATGDYLLISDGDCIPHPEFLEIHVRLAKPGRFLSGGRCMLTPELTQKLTAEDISSGRLFDSRWLAEHSGLSRPRDAMKLRKPAPASFLDRVTPTKATWNGHNSSGWKSDILEVNGFDERLGYGGLDREMGERLMNLGIRARQIRHRAICFHLDHERGYVDPEVVRSNKEIRRAVTGKSSRFSRVSGLPAPRVGPRSHWTDHGIVKRG